MQHFELQDKFTKGNDYYSETAIIEIHDDVVDILIIKDGNRSLITLDKYDLMKAGLVIKKMSSGEMASILPYMEAQ